MPEMPLFHSIKRRSRLGAGAAGIVLVCGGPAFGRVVLCSLVAVREHEARTSGLRSAVAEAILNQDSKMGISVYSKPRQEPQRAQSMAGRAIGVQPPGKSSSAEWLSLAIWAAVAFTFSTSAFSGANTLATNTTILRWLFPAISSLSASVGNVLIRKAAHFVEFAILFWLLVRGPFKGRPFAAIALCVGCALLDEGHQLFVAGRISSLHDVALDSTGAMFGGFLRAAISEIF